MTLLCALQSTAALLSVLLSFSPVEVGIAKVDCQTYCLLCLYCLVLLVCIACSMNDMKWLWNTFWPPRRMSSGSVCVANKTWTCMTECPSELKWTPSFPVLFNVYSPLFLFLPEVSFPVASCPFFYLAGMASDWLAMAMSMTDDPQWWNGLPLAWTRPSL